VYDFGLMLLTSAGSPLLCLVAMSDQLIPILLLCLPLSFLHGGDFRLRGCQLTSQCVFYLAWLNWHSFLRNYSR